MRRLEVLWKNCFILPSGLKKATKYWNLVLWCARRAIYNVLVSEWCRAKDEQVDFEPPAKIITVNKWKKLLTDIVTSISKTGAAVDWMCVGKWLSFSQDDGTHTLCNSYGDHREDNGNNLFIVM